MALADGESLATRTEAIDYATKRGWTDFLALDGDVQDARLRDGYDYIAAKTTWPGRLADTAQVGPFPRVGMTDREGRVVIGTPDQAKSANIEAARLAIAGPLMGGAQQQAVIRKKIGPIEKEFADPLSADQVRRDRLAYVHSLIRAAGGKLADGGSVTISKA